MEILEFSSEYFDATATLDCGQIFRYKSINGGYLVFSGDKVCFLQTQNGVTVLKSEELEYFKNFFDLDRDYKVINDFCNSSKFPIVQKSSKCAKGIRILNQLKEEMIFSFLISQNNMIPRIKAIIERTCKALGEKRFFDGEEYYSFPSAKILASKDEEFYKNLGYGYRAKYMVEVASVISSGIIDVEELAKLPTPQLKKSLLTLTGIGPKVADCISLFGYHRSDSFPVDTWIEKLYKEDFNGSLTDRNKITDWFTAEFKEYSGYVQQYLFYYKRSLEKNENG